jgi:acyl-CoA reductase-like NAD-dependent aldehyde dehydrogenase
MKGPKFAITADGACFVIQGASGNKSSGRHPMHQQFMVAGRPAGTPPADSAPAPEAAAPIFASLDQALAELGAAREAWVDLGILARLAVLDQIVQEMLLLREDWVAAGVADKEIGHIPWAAGLEWCLLANIFRYLGVIRRALVDIQRHGRPRVPGRIYGRPDGQVVAEVFPQTLYDRGLFPGVSGEVWLAPDVTLREAQTGQAQTYHGADRPGRVCLVLGGGNASQVPVIDALHKLFVEGQVVLLKLNPANAYLAPLIQAGLQPLIGRGFLRVVTGGVEEGEYLCRQPAVNTIHMTGSDRTFEAITFGTGAEGAARKATRTPILAKPFTAELGNVGPLIVVPGAWSRRNLDDMAEQIATWLAFNAGCLCATPRVLITYRGWPQRAALLSAIRHVLAGTTTCKAFYPGAHARYAAFMAAHPEAERFGTEVHDRLPWMLIADVDANRTDDICFKTESFCSVYAETALAAADPAAFVDAAVDFANNALWGTLSATVVVHPGSLRDRSTAAAFDRGLANLRYGTITVNLDLPYAYYMLLGPWGAFPGHAIYDIQSGTGHIHNLLMFDRPQKTVYRAPFTKLADPIRVTYRHSPEFGRSLVAFDAQPTPWRLLKTGWSVLKH